MIALLVVGVGLIGWHLAGAVGAGVAVVVTTASLIALWVWTEQ